MLGHWFLCARDVMWVCVGMTPILLVPWRTVREYDDVANFCLAVTFQWALIAALYFQVIR